MWKESCKYTALETQYMPFSYACFYLFHLYEMYDFGISLHSLARIEKFLFISSIHRPFWITAYRSIIIDASFFLSPSTVKPPLFFSLQHSPVLFFYHHQACRLQITSHLAPLLSFYLYLWLFFSIPIRHANYNPTAKSATWWLRIFLHQPFTCQCIIDFSPSRMFFSHTSRHSCEACCCHYAFATQSIFFWCCSSVKTHRLFHW